MIWKLCAWQALTFRENQHLVVNNLKIQDAQQMHVSFDKCVDVQASNLVVTAPGDSPNTDGIHVSNTQNILIASSTIGTGMFNIPKLSKSLSLN